ncbi:hypothetical protein AVEN_225131-2-1, partial [Araneus ventricosus]
RSEYDNINQQVEDDWLRRAGADSFVERVGGAKYLGPGANMVPLNKPH